MEIEKVIEIMQEHINVCTANKTDINIEFMVNKGLLRKVDIADFKQHEEKQIEAYEIAVQALEKQIPKKPNALDCCTECDTYLKDDNGVEGDYCPNCGQRVDWGDEHDRKA